METRILDGRKTAGHIEQELGDEIRELAAIGLVPGLAAIVVGDNPASRLYVRSKVRSCRQLGMHSEQLELSERTTTRELLGAIGELNRRDEIDGILVQLPLPSHLDRDRILQSVHPAKDVDGLNPLNAGKLFQGRPALIPCTPLGILELLRREKIPLEGSHAVVVGRSNIVGKPLAILLLQQHCTVTLCHSRTRDLPGVCRTADLLVVAAGRPALLGSDAVKKGAVVIDVGTNRLDTEEQVRRLFGEDSKKMEAFRTRGSVLVGDVHPREVMGVASAVTPVPGGVGPLTIAFLLKNTVTACRMRRAKPLPASRG